MKKITLLVLATLTLVAVSCGVNSLNPEKLELQKLPVSGALVTGYDEVLLGGSQDTTVDYVKHIGVPAVGTTFTGVAMVGNNTTGPFLTTEANIMFDATTGDYTVSLYDIPKNTYNIMKIQYSKNTTTTDFDKLAITKPSDSGTIAAVANPLTYSVPGYKLDGGTGSSGTGPSHTAYFATANKDSEIFSVPLLRDITATPDGKNGTIVIPTAADGQPLNGGKYKIWVLEIYKQP